MHIPLVSFRAHVWTGLVLGAVWALFGATYAQPRPDVTLWVEGDSVTSGEPFILNIEGSTPAHRGIAFPSAEADSVFGGVEVLKRSKVYTRRVGGGYAIDSVSYTMKTSARDSVRIPPVPIQVDVAVGTLTTHTEPYTVWVRDRKESPSGLFGVVAAHSSAATIGRWGLAIGMLLLLGGSAYLWVVRRDRRGHQLEEASTQAGGHETEDVTSYEIALQQLRELRSHDLGSPEAVEAFYVGLANAVRTYLAGRLDIATRERTTGELITLLDRRSDVPSDAVEQCRTVLEQADLVKFAAVRPDAETAEEAVATVRAGLDEIEAAVADSPDGARGTSATDAAA